MVDWSSVEFASTAPRSRKAQDLLPILSDVMVIVDFIACAAAGWLALMLYTRMFLGLSPASGVAGPFWRDIVFGSLITALVLRDPASLYGRWPSSTWQCVMKAEGRCLLAFTILIAVGEATDATDNLARLWLASWLVVFGCAVSASRLALMMHLRALDGRGEFQETIAIVGNSADLSERLAARISPEARVVGQYTTGGPDEAGTGDLFNLSDLLELGRNGGVNSVIVAVGDEKDADIRHVVQRLKALPIQVAICKDQGWSNLAAPQMRLLGGMPMAVVADRPLKRWDLLLKTVFDKVGAAVLLVAVTPLLAAIAVGILLSSPGPVIFRQQREGWSGKRFVVFKFRTMCHVPSGGQASQTQRQDPRCTRFGQTLRNCSLDELPQLWNVLRGDMSLVGPRPHVDSLHDVGRAGREIVAEYAQRNRVKPGMTGWAQVNGARGATATLAQLRRRVAYDLYYIENWSLWFDIKILLRTPFRLMGDNAF